MPGQSSILWNPAIQFVDATVKLGLALCSCGLLVPQTFTCIALDFRAALPHNFLLKPWCQRQPVAFQKVQPFRGFTPSGSAKLWMRETSSPWQAFEKQSDAGMGSYIKLTPVQKPLRFYHGDVLVWTVPKSDAEPFCVAAMMSFYQVSIVFLLAISPSICAPNSTASSAPECAVGASYTRQRLQTYCATGWLMWHVERVSCVFPV